MPHLQEIFLPGSLFAVKDLSTVRGERRVINFYSAARLDGLVRRDEIFGVKLVEHFVGRDDRLEYRSATFGAPGAAGGAGAADGVTAGSVQQHSDSSSATHGAGVVSSAGANGAATDRAPPIKKITEKYKRNADKSADADVAKRVFHLAAAKTVLQLHHGEGRLTAGSLVFHKDGPAQAVQVDPLAPKPQARELLETYKSLQTAEKEVLQHVRDSEWEGREIGRMRSNQEQSITLEAPYYDITRIQVLRYTTTDPGQVTAELLIGLNSACTNFPTFTVRLQSVQLQH